MYERRSDLLRLFDILKFGEILEYSELIDEIYRNGEDGLLESAARYSDFICVYLASLRRRMKSKED